MIYLPGNRVGIIPVSDPDETGGLYSGKPGEVIRLSDGTEVTLGDKVSLTIPETARERTDQGVVKYIGPKVQDVKVGMYVLFSGWSGSALLIEDPATGKVERLLILPEDFITAQMNDLDQIDIPGLYFKGKDGTYWTATYEQAMELIAAACRYTRAENPLPVSTARPEVADYDKLRGG